MRNPWGKGEWQGDWSDKWIEDNKQQFSEMDLKTLNYKQRLPSGKDPTDDGCFWMSWSDFLKQFENIAVCHLPTDNFHEIRARGIFRYHTHNIFKV